MDLADACAVGCVAVDAVEALAGPTGCRPHVAVDITADAVTAAGGHVHEDAAIGEPPPFHHVEDTDVGWTIGFVRTAGVNDVKELFIRREAETIGAHKVIGDDGHLPRLPVDTVDIGGQFGLGLVAFVVHQDAITGISKPDAAI